MDFESMLTDTLTDYYIDRMPFNKILGVEIHHLDYQTGEAVTRIKMKDDLIGNFSKKILHGGVSSSLLDLTGGLSALISCAKIHEGKTPAEIHEKLTKCATIDMRVDFLNPGRGDWFVCKSRVIRAGSRVVVAKVDFLNDSEIRIVTGTATYMIG